jgi:hypothetical protein
MAATKRTGKVGRPPNKTARKPAKGKTTARTKKR